MKAYLALVLLSNFMKKNVGIKMLWIMVDVEADGPQVAKHSMISFGAVVCSNPSQTFYGKCKPIGDQWVPEALAVSGFTREDTLQFPEAKQTMADFDKWLTDLKIAKDTKRVSFISDNNGFDWQFINWYFLEFVGRNPFGHSSFNLGSFYKGVMRDNTANFKRFRKTKHDHNPVNDALGNVEALRQIRKMHGIVRF